jgi:hypothetical protein
MRWRTAGSAGGRPQRGGVGAVGEWLERAGSLERVLHHPVIGSRELGRERSQPGEATAQARHAQIQELTGLHASHSGGGARLAVHGHPGRRVGIEAALHASKRVVRVGFAGRAEGRVHLLLARVVPDPCELWLRARAERRLSRPQHDDGAGGERDQQHTGRRHEAAPAESRGIVLQSREERDHGRVAVGRSQRQPPDDDLPQPAGDVAACAGAADLAGAYAGHERGEVVPLEGRLAVERLVEADAVAELVGAGVGAFAGELLGRHVLRRADQPSVLGQRCLEPARSGSAGRGFAEAHGGGHGPCGRLRHAEVDDTGASVESHEHVVRLEVTVDEPRVVRRGEPASGLHEHGDDVAPGPRGL